MSSTLGFALLIVFGGQATLGQNDTDENAEEVQIKKWVEYYAAEAAKYEFSQDTGRPTKFVLRPDPVLRWGNPVRRGKTHGAVFVWTNRGRAEVIGTIFSYIPASNPDVRSIAHSFHSLSSTPLDASRDGKQFWSPRQAGLEFTVVPAAEKPHERAALRLAQMRKLARQFTATSILQEERHQLRLLTQPIHQYKESSADILDGGLFAFVTGTDPELILVIEARKQQEAYVWQFAAARFSDLTLKLRHQDAEVWNYEKGGSSRSPKNSYISLHGVAIRDNIIE